MKSRYNFLLTIMLINISLMSCKQDYIKFNNELAAIRFDYKSTDQDSTLYSFALRPGIMQDTVKIPVQLIGFTSLIAREISVEIDEANSTAKEGRDFTLLKSIIAPESLKGTVDVLVIRHSLESDNLKLSVNLKSNAFFSADVLNRNAYKIILTNKLVKPSDWPSAFGDYSPIKHDFVIKVTQIGTDYGKLSQQQIIYYLGVLNKALYNYNKENEGNPLVDESGRLITF